MHSDKNFVEEELNVFEYEITIIAKTPYSVQIWRVEKQGNTFELVLLDKKYYSLIQGGDKKSFGQLFGGDCYVIQYTYTVSNREHHIIYYWLVRLELVIKDRSTFYFDIVKKTQYSLLRLSLYIHTGLCEHIEKES